VVLTGVGSALRIAVGASVWTLWPVRVPAQRAVALITPALRASIAVRILRSASPQAVTVIQRAVGSATLTVVVVFASLRQAVAPTPTVKLERSGVKRGLVFPVITVGSFATWAALRALSRRNATVVIPANVFPSLSAAPTPIAVRGCAAKQEISAFSGVRWGIPAVARVIAVFLTELSVKAPIPRAVWKWAAPVNRSACPTRGSVSPLTVPVVLTEAGSALRIAAEASA